MNYLLSALSWVFGVFFLITGLIGLFNWPLGGMCFLLIALILLPPVRKLVHSKTNKRLPTKGEALALTILLITGVVAVVHVQAKKNVEQKSQETARARQQKIDHFNANRDAIISSVQSAMEENNYKLAISLASDYLVVGDKQLEELHARAQIELSNIQNAERTEQLLVELKNLARSDYQRNTDIYKELVKLHPENKDYNRELTSFSKRLSQEQEKKEKPARQAAFEKKCPKTVAGDYAGVGMSCAEFVCGKCSSAEKFNNCLFESIKTAVARNKHGCPKLYTARSIHQIYSNNEVRADQTFKGQAVLIKGTSDSVGKDILGSTYVSLSAGNYGFSTVQLYPKRGDGFLSVIDKGDTVWAVCIGSGQGLMNPTFYPCNIIAVFGR